MRAFWWLAIALPLTWPPAAAQQPPKVIMVDVTFFPSEFNEFSKARERLDSLVAQRLRDAGFTVIPAESSEAVWNRQVDSVGGFYDTYTGKLVQEKFKAVRAGTLREMRTRFRADAWLHPVLQVRTASFDGSQVDWDGVREPSGAVGGAIRLLFGSDAGTTSALSLMVQAEDMDGKTFYTRAGGIQLLMKVYREGLLPVPRETVFAVDSLSVRAVRIALDALTPAALDSIH
ncbi:MAG TPA: hypothetical protein VFK78_12335 [Gemmatimonadales bacterium]|nr:hypothetical protein [Gemmatimonadales bacterium]